MTSKELYDKLSGYVGLRVRISSDATSSGSWRDSYPELTEVVMRESDGAVCCKTNDGVWCIVIEAGLKIEFEPAIGTHDFASPVRQMELIGAARKAYDEAPAGIPDPPESSKPKRRRLDWSDW